MPTIAILPDDVADQIAAGEVVERPASVVKELVENALDAGARQIEICVEDGGRSLIRVSDDGCGMDRDDALLALERHGTSKIRSAHDLGSVSSFGFRGEALPAIASVSDVDIETSVADGAGVRVSVTAGRVRDIGEATRRKGTTVSVARLFHNVPARLKFLRSARSEWRAISDAITSTALARRDVRLDVKHERRNVLELPPANDLRARVAAIWGARYAERLLAVDAVVGAVRVTGLVERPGEVGTATRRAFVSVNGRPVRDAGMIRAAEAAFRSTIPAGTRPSVFLEITLPAESVDVNVHPAKAEVRFRDRWTVERAVETAVRRVLGGLESAAHFQALGTRHSALEPQALGTRHWALETATSGEASGPQPDDVPLVPQSLVPSAECVAPEYAEPIQLRRTYILVEHDHGVLLIDQHAAHERILFEDFLNTFERGGAPSQRLLLPMTLHLDPVEAEALDQNRDVLERIGFELESFGGNSVLVHAVPCPHPRFDAARCLRETLDALTGDRMPGTIARHERLLATVACKAAVKAGDALSRAEMSALLTRLGSVDLPAHDVHGRSAVVHLTWMELERRFGRR